MRRLPVAKENTEAVSRPWPQAGPPVKTGACHAPVGAGSPRPPKPRPAWTIAAGIIHNTVIHNVVILLRL